MALTNPESCNKHYSNWYRHIVIAGCMPFLTAVVFLFHLYHTQAGLASIAHPLRHGFHKNLSCIQNTRVGTLWLNHTTFKATLNYLQHFDFVWLEKKTIPSKLKPTKYSIWQPALSIPTLAQRLSCCLAQSWQSTANQTNPGAMHASSPSWCSFWMVGLGVGSTKNLWSWQSQAWNTVRRDSCLIGKKSKKEETKRVANWKCMEMCSSFLVSSKHPVGRNIKALSWNHHTGLQKHVFTL